ncbi:hypothetical protein E2C01_047896 [Portunus trituberculatus]|uniref:Uncharacterized protein n=1 Tax=Portunus trituberculatus TaxID=210409 RepID=A0A5B7G295_PORTR|nr:hypothetical protein [Portunus trituberculatus]
MFMLSVEYAEIDMEHSYELSSQSAWRPHLHPVECRENNQVSNEFLPGRRQVHLFFTLLRHSH